MTRRRFAGIAIGSTALLIGGCLRREDPTAPPTIRYGRDVCSRCGMIISDATNAAAYRTSSGEVRVFDDVGEMFIDERERGDSVAAFFVHDYGSREWLPANQAWFVVSRGLRTPMGVGVVAVGSEKEALELSRRFGGDVASFEQLRGDKSLSAAGGHAR